MAICCKNFLTQLLAKERGFGAVDLNQVKEHLLGFKKLLEKLSHEDLSRTITFTRKLSDLWIELHEDLRKIQLFEAETPRIGPDLKTTLDAIGSFPPGADHRLGYYLKEHVGQEWLPFPFMDILSLLYKEHLRRGSRSILTIWLSLLADTLFHFEQGPSA
ncbi:MAG: hypothetical protein HYX48_08045 [Chlamydiales bacterium]|nr:hypothetical protein [Chlamydiales bacterium]